MLYGVGVQLVASVFYMVEDKYFGILKPTIMTDLFESVIIDTIQRGWVFKGIPQRRLAVARPVHGAYFFKMDAIAAAHYLKTVIVYLGRRLPSQLVAIAFYHAIKG